jgi:hypothetical protein
MSTTTTIVATALPPIPHMPATGSQMIAVALGALLVFAGLVAVRTAKEAKRG